MAKNQIRNMKKLLFYILAIFILFGCSFTIDFGVSFDYDLFLKNQKKWQKGNLKKYYYEHKIKHSGFVNFSEHSLVTVSNYFVKKVDIKFGTLDSTNVSKIQNGDDPIDLLYCEIENMYLDAKNQNNSFQYFYLKGIEIDYYPNSCLKEVKYNYYYDEDNFAVDGINYGFSILNFRQL